MAAFNDNYGGTTTWMTVAEVFSSGSPVGAVTADPEPQDPEPQDDGMKTILVYPQEGITNATVNGIPVIVGQDNRVEIDPNQPLQMKYNFINSRGQMSEAIQDLDTYYDFHVLKASGGWSSSKYQASYETDKTGG